MVSKPIVLIINQHYLPGWKTGGPVRTISNMVDWLGDDFHFKVLTADRDRGDIQAYPDIQPGKWYTVGKAEVRYLTSSEFSLLRLHKILLQTSYDVLYLNSVLAELVIRTLLISKLHLIYEKPMVVAPRGHLNQDALKVKAAKKQLFLRTAKLLRLFQNTTWHVSAQNEREDVIREFGPGQLTRIHVIPNLASKNGHSQLPPITKNSGELRAVFLSRVLPNKNLDLALQALRELHGRVYFDIYGTIEDTSYWNECRNIIASLPSAISVNYRGVALPSEVIPLLATYHLFVLPTKFENFGHAILEAVSAGCPVLISDRTPWKDVEEKGAGWVVSLSTPDLFQERMQEVVDMDSISFAAIQCRATAYGKQVTNITQAVDETRELLNAVALRCS